MAIRGVNLAEKEPFIHPDDPGHEDHAEFKAAVKAGKPTEKPTTYYIGNLTAADRVELGDMGATPTMRDGGITMSLRNTARAYEVVKRGLKDWDNQLAHDDKPAKFTMGTVRTATGDFQPCVDDSSMLFLPNFIINSLAQKILEKNGMSIELEKKSEGASSLSDDLSSVIGDAPLAPPTNNENGDVPKAPKGK